MIWSNKKGETLAGSSLSESEEIYFFFFATFFLGAAFLTAFFFLTAMVNLTPFATRVMREIVSNKMFYAGKNVHHAQCELVFLLHIVKLFFAIAEKFSPRFFRPDTIGRPLRSHTRAIRPRVR